MRIFACSDFHGARIIMDKLPCIKDKADLILLCGDLCGRKFGQPTENLPDFQRTSLSYIRKILTDAGISFRYIFGNDDWIEDTYPERLTGTEKIGDITICPLELVPINRNKTNRETTEDVIERALSPYSGGNHTIVLSHTPPYGACDLAHSGKQCGSMSARQWIIQHEPLAWFCGHIHEDYSTDTIGNTRIFNCAVNLWGTSLRGWLFDTVTGAYESLCIE